MPSPLNRLRRLLGNGPGRPAYRTAAGHFLRALGLVYLIAFGSLWVQAHGLIGSGGILPLGDSMRYVAEQLGPGGFLRYPTLFWISGSDTALHLVCGAGVLLSLAAILLPAGGPLWLLLWACYLSLVTAGEPFLSFQWDALLLEAGFLALFLAPWTGLPKPGTAVLPAPAVAWLYRWLLFRLMFASGVVKLTSKDPTWADLTALTYHYQTQPIPNPVAWYAHHLPETVHITSAAGMFAIEIAVPFLIFGPRRLRLLACGLLAGLQLLIALTGNYTFFNLLTLALCLWLVDDASWPARLRPKAPYAPPPGHPLRRYLLVPFAALVLLLSALYLTSFTFRIRVPWPAPLVSLYRTVAPFHLVSTYGLFQVMTTERPEIVLEGSRDGKTWNAYEFPYKPGDLTRAPPFVAPHQPRLDWQMWFAALSTARRTPWFLRFCTRLLEGSPPVLALLSHNPFPDRPPRYLRARLYDYRFTSPGEKRATGAWWKREYIRDYLPAVQGPSGE